MALIVAALARSTPEGAAIPDGVQSAILDVSGMARQMMKDPSKNVAAAAINSIQVGLDCFNSWLAEWVEIV